MHANAKHRTSLDQGESMNIRYFFMDVQLLLKCLKPSLAMTPSASPDQQELIRYMTLTN